MLAALQKCGDSKFPLVFARFGRLSGNEIAAQEFGIPRSCATGLQLVSFSEQ